MSALHRVILATPRRPAVVRIAPWIIALATLLLAVVFVAFPNHAAAQTSNTLTIGTVGPVHVDNTVDVPVTYTSGTPRISAFFFSLNYDPACLDADVDNNGEIDHIEYPVVPAPYIKDILIFNETSNPGVIGIAIYRFITNPEVIPNGDLVRVRFKAICEPAIGETTVSNVVFGPNPREFSSPGGLDVSPILTNGSVSIQRAPIPINNPTAPDWDVIELTGECNTYGSITIPSQTGVIYKIDGVEKVAGTYDNLQGTHTVTAHAAPGYVLSGTTSWNVPLGSYYPCQVTPTPPVFTPIALCGTTGSIEIIAMSGVKYLLDGVEKPAGVYDGLSGEHSVVAEPLPGHVLTGITEWLDVDLGEVTTCIDPVDAEPTFTTITTCGQYATVTYPAGINGVQANYAVTVGTPGQLQGVVQVTATAIGAYRFPPNDTTKVYTSVNLGEYHPCVPGNHVVTFGLIDEDFCNTYGNIVLPENEFVDFDVPPGPYSGSVTVTVTALDPYRFPGNLQVITYTADLGDWEPCTADDIIAPTFLPIITCGDYGQIVIPDVEGVVYLHNGVPVDTPGTIDNLVGLHDVEVEAAEGYILGGGEMGPWLNVDLGAFKTCTSVTEPPWTAISACNMWGSFTMPTLPAEVTWSLDKPVPDDDHWEGTYILTATANTGFAFEPLLPSKSFTLTFGAYTPCEWDLDITIDPAIGGDVDVDPTGGTYVHGTVVTLTVEANAGYAFYQWSGADAGDVATTPTPGVYTIVMDEDRTLVAEFRLNDYTIVASAGSNGTISPSGNVPVTHGQNQAFNFNPATGYEVDTLTVDGANVPSPGSSYTFSNVSEDHEIHVTFKLKTYTITATAGANGSISPSGAVVVNHGADQSFTITPNTGYEVDVLTVDGSPVASALSYTFEDVEANHTISVTFKLKTYTITATAGANGSISPSGSVVVNHGADQSFTITPNTGYEVDVLTVDGSPVAAALSYTFEDVDANHTISVTFKLKTYTITATAGANGTISPSGAVVVNHGADQSFTITPNTGYEVDVLTVDGTPVASALSYTFEDVEANHTISVTFKLKTYTITATAGANGSISPSGAVVVNHGADQSFTITPNTGYEVDVLTVDGSPVASALSYTFEDVDANHTISVTFKLKTYTITATAGTNGTISPSGSVVVNHGADQSFTITPNTGYEVNVLTVDGSPVAAALSYTFEDVEANHTISVTFKLKTYTITATAGANGSISPSGAVVVNHGADQAFTITPNTGYEVDVLTVDGTPMASALSYTFEDVDANHTISVTFKQITPVTVPGSIGNRVWNDSDGDGVQNGGEPGVEGVVVELYRVVGGTPSPTALLTTTTNADGLYNFPNLSTASGLDTYVVRYILPAGYGFTSANVGSDSSDSDANPETGYTPAIALSSGEADSDEDAGIYRASLSSAKFTAFSETVKGQPVVIAGVNVVLPYNTSGDAWEVTSHFIITNTGTVNLIIDEMVDDVLGAIDCPAVDSPLAPGASIQCSAAAPYANDENQNRLDVTASVVGKSTSALATDHASTSASSSYACRGNELHGRWYYETNATFNGFTPGEDFLFKDAPESLVPLALRSIELPITLARAGQAETAVRVVLSNDGSFQFSNLDVGEAMTYTLRVGDDSFTPLRFAPVGSSLRFNIKAEDCTTQTFDVGYARSTQATIGDFVWFDVNENGVQDEWYDADGDGKITQNNDPDTVSLDENGFLSLFLGDYEFIDLNGNGQPDLEGELNKCGIRSTGPAVELFDGENNVLATAIAGNTGYFRFRNTNVNGVESPLDPQGTYGVRLLPNESNPLLVSGGALIAASGLCKERTDIPIVAAAHSATLLNFDGSPLQAGELRAAGGGANCASTTVPGMAVDLSNYENGIALDADYGVVCVNDPSATPGLKVMWLPLVSDIE